jgi:hypothetical protein
VRFSWLLHTLPLKLLPLPQNARLEESQNLGIHLVWHLVMGAVAGLKQSHLQQTGWMSWPLATFSGCKPCR